MHSRSYVNAYLTLDSQGNLCLFCTMSVKTKLTNSFVPVVPVNCPLPYHGKNIEKSLCHSPFYIPAPPPSPSELLMDVMTKTLLHAFFISNCFIKN